MRLERTGRARAHLEIFVCVQAFAWQRCWRRPAWRPPRPPLTVDQLLAQGWEIAGYASGYDNRTSLILFRHPGMNTLVQCGVLYDVTRNPHTIVNCYELR